MKSKNHSYKLALAAGAIAAALVTTNTFAQQGMGIGNNNPQEMLDVSGAIKLGTTTTTNAGTIRWTGTEFQGWDGTQWITFGGGIATQLTEAQVEAFVTNGPIDLFAGTTINGNPILTTEVDGSTTNEIQDLQLVGNILTITNNGTATQIDLSPYVNAAVTLDAAYDQGGAGAGREIDAVDGTVAITGEDGIMVSGTFGSGLAVGATGGIAEGAGTRMFFNPSKAAFRAGSVDGTQWDDANIGYRSTAMGTNTKASGYYSTAMGYVTTALGTVSTAMGYETTASGNVSTAMGLGTIAPSSTETAIGRYNTTYTHLSTNSWNAADRLFVVGNGTSTSARSNALTIYKDGRMNINDEYDMPTADGAANTVMTTNGFGVVSFVDPNTLVTPTTTNTLDEAYDQGGAGAGRVIDAVDGAVRINGEDGFLVTGTVGSGVAIEVSGAGARMFYNPKKAAFRAGRVLANQWDDANVGNYSVALGASTTAEGDYSTAFGASATASGVRSTAMGSNTVAEGDYSTAMGYQTTAASYNSTAMGRSTNASGNYSTAMGSNTTAPSFVETAVGRFNTAYAQASATGWNTEDRLFVVGNGTSTSARSNALTIYKDGKMNINDEYDMPIADGTAGQVMTTDGAGVVSFVDPGTLNPVIFANASGVTSNANGIYATDDFVFGSPQLADNGNTANDNRFFFDKSKAAFRAGNASSDQWDDANVGNYSVALGANTTASGEISTAFGASATASGVRSTAMGSNTVAEGDYSTAMGYQTTASEFASTAMGRGTTAAGDYSTAMGYQTNASGDYSTAMGRSTNASGNYSTAMGSNTTAPSFVETAVGRFNTAYAQASATGWNTEDRLFVVGNGTSTSARSNALTIYKDGKMNINDEYDMPIADGTAGQVMTTDGAGVVSFVDPNTLVTPTTTNTLDKAYDQGGAGAGRVIDAVDGTVAITGEDGIMVSGTYNSGLAVGATGGIAQGAGTRMFFNPRKAAFRAGYVDGTQWDDVNIGYRSTAMGNSTKASEFASTAMGSYTTASGIVSTAMGAVARALGSYSTAMGAITKAEGAYSTAMGLETTASGYNSTAMGAYTTAQSGYETAIGRYNTTYSQASATGWNDADRLFVIGNGTGNSTRSNAMVVRKNGNTGIGVSTPTYKLQVNGQPAAAGYTQFTNYSDARLKTNITDLESSLEKIMALRPISYNYNETYLKLYNDTTSLVKVHKGFIAQEIKEVFPEMVGTVNIEGTEYFDLNLSNLPVYTIKAIQEQQAQIEAQKLQNEQQQALIEQLLQRIEQLENK